MALLALAALLLGFFAMAVTPKEKEPQIDVAFANIFIASAKEVEQLMAIPAQQVLTNMDDIFSVSSPGQAILTVAFDVDIPAPIIKLMGTDDVLTLSNKPFNSFPNNPQTLSYKDPEKI
jgi:multidrug efflux pump subunit AcrB